MAELRRPRPPEGYVWGPGADHVLVPRRVAAWLDREAGLDRLRVEVRGQDPEIDAVLVALRLAALAWRGSVTGTDDRNPPEPVAESSVMTTRVEDD